MDFIINSVPRGRQIQGTTFAARSSSTYAPWQGSALCTCSSGSAELCSPSKPQATPANPPEAASPTQTGRALLVAWHRDRGLSARGDLSHSSASPQPRHHWLPFLLCCSICAHLTPSNPGHPGMLCPPCPLQRSHFGSEILSITVMLHNYCPVRAVEQDSH